MRLRVPVSSAGMSRAALELRWKPDFPQTIARFEAWWQGELLDRPPVTISVKPSRTPRHVPAGHSSHRDRWLDAEYVVDSAIAALEALDWVGDSFPIIGPNIGPEITATLYGAELEFDPHTAWSQPVIHEVGQWETLLQRAPDFENVYWQTAERITALAIERCDQRYVVGLTDLHGNFDILAALRDPQMLCLDVLDCPELVHRAACHVARGYVEAFQRNYNQVSAAGFGSTCWTPMYHRGPAYVPSCEFWCLVSADIARALIWPVISMEMEPLKRSIFHLDGPQALRHLDLVLRESRLNALQWVYGAGHGHARDWIEVYRRARAAGKSVQVLAETACDALEVLAAVGPRGVWLHVMQPFETLAEARAFLGEVARCRR
ncbi:MAG: hypothetical protein NZ483_02370 [Verrucomicrobiae bacterium]|nr:hypothetical protein [Verrucomicrobiae bacterium]